ncbi:MAG: hypothetical protein JWM11_1995, partial [Planctomycetaceae bacterium]|nr:hypothetical protein [Planctomycetaceae bacterium]
LEKSNPKTDHSLSAFHFNNFSTHNGDAYPISPIRVTSTFFHGEKTVDFCYGMSISRVTEFLRPLPLDRNRLVDLESALKYDEPTHSFCCSTRSFISNYGDIVVTSKRFPQQLFSLRFGKGPDTRLIRVELIQQERYMMWLLYWHGTNVARVFPLWPQPIIYRELPPGSTLSANRGRTSD